MTGSATQEPGTKPLPAPTLHHFHVNAVDPARSLEWYAHFWPQGKRTTVAGFPNLFFLVGPNSAGGYNSIIFTSESHINYVARAVREMERANVATVEVRPEVYDAFSRETEQRLGESVWNQGGCASWYIDANGRNGVWWPGFTADLWRRTRRFDRSSYLAESASTTR